MNLNINKLALRLVMLFAAVAMSVNLYAQGGVSGVVVDSAGEPVLGAAIVVDGTTTGTITDLDGKFTLNAAPGAAVTISFIGYTDVKTALSEGMSVVLQDDATEIEQLVVVGYGAVKKETLTGSIAVVGEEMFQEKGTGTNPLSSLQGQVPGVFVSRSSSAPGSEDWSINLRGATSINSSDPLVVIDGFVCSSVDEMRLINQNDIESMSFLKDGAAAIYGSNAAAGVILITTKKGKEGKVKVEYSMSATYKYLGNSPSLMDLEEYATSRMEAENNRILTSTSTAWTTYYQLMLDYAGGIIDVNSTALPFASWEGLDDFPLFDDESWYDSLWGSCWSTSHNLSFSGATDKSSYHVSFGYLYDGSQLQYGENDNQRYNVRTNNSYKLADNINWNSTISYDREMNVVPTNLSGALTKSLPQPGLPLQDINGNPYTWGGWESPYGQLTEGGETNTTTDKIIINQSMDYKPVDWVTLTATGGFSTNIVNKHIVTSTVDYYTYLGDYYITTPTAENTSYVMTTGVTNNYSLSGYGNLTKTFNEVHDIAAMAGVQYDMKEYTYYGIEAEEILESLEIVNGSGDVTIYGKNRWQTATMSAFGRFNYAYDSRYLFEVNGRYDGSSKFTEENRWDMFGGGSFAWRINQEDFMQDVSWLNNLKLRFSYAQMGTQAGIGNYDGVQLYNLTQGSGAYIGDGLLSYISTNGEFASQTRQWERIESYNIGVDFDFLNKLSGAFDIYRKNNNNMLISIDMPSTLGDTAPDANVGVFRSQGWEFMLNYRETIGEVSFNIGATVSYQENFLLEYEGTSLLTAGYSSTRVGYGLNSLFGYQSDGKFSTDEEAMAFVEKYYDDNACSMPTALRAGDNRLVDVNEDGKIDEDDLVYIGSDTSPYSFSLNAGVSYKGFDLSATFQGEVGRQVYTDAGNWVVPTRNNYHNGTDASIGNVWTPETPDAYYSPYTLDSDINTYNYQESTATAQNGSYLRLKNVTLGYTLPSKYLENVALSGLRVYVTGVDLWEVSGMEQGWDPEASRSTSGTTSYPFMRSITFGVNLTF